MSSSSTHSQFIMVGLSGGVDSSVSALLLKQQGYQVAGLFMKNWVDLEGDGQCPIEEDLKDAGHIAERLEIDFYTENFAPEYWDRVFAHFLDEYKAGRTPNPDVLCNKEIKFDLFLHRAMELGADKIATGHYARLEEQDGLQVLKKAVDLNKDQTYFLHALNQYQLSRSVFPLGEMHKPEVRDIATQYHFQNSGKKDSTGICFIGEKNFGEFLSQYLPAQPGLMQTPDGKTVSEHMGLMYYTLGQRKGIGIGGRQDSGEDPWFVVGKRIQDNILVIAQGHDHPLLYSRELKAIDVNWISGEELQLPLRCSAKTRYRQDDQACTIVEKQGEHYIVQFDEPQRAMTPGQSAVFYLDDVCLGGGVIDFVKDIIYQ
ncbi:MAG: tRNA 2-thiouridine(34) synthase MnmA [Gammaproteobacteria bacterium]|nr:tRNA 2-thiouridine(34) synthase MnmA [Gammaproteobacteria bacterium]